MDKFWNSRIFRVLVCLILVCCILVNASPIKAKAVTPIALTGWAILALTAALGAGVVLNPATPQVANAIGEELNKTAQRVVPDGWDTISKVCDHLDNMVPEWDPGDYHNDLKTALAGGLLTAITAMIVSAVADGVVNTEVKEEDYSVVDGESVNYKFYNSSETVTSDAPFVLVGFRTELEVENASNMWCQSIYAFSSSSNRLTRTYSKGTQAISKNLDSDSGVYYARVNYVSGQGGPYTMEGGFPVIDLETTIEGFDSASIEYGCQMFLNDGKITVPVVPEIYVGDIPQKIQNGEDDPEKLNIPPIDPSRFVTSPDTAFEEITKVGQDIKNGTTTYNEFVTNNQFQQPTPNPDNPDPSTPPDTSDPTEETEPDEEEEKPIGEMGNFTLDLSDYFPFCVPFDIYDFFSCLSASPVAPVIHWEVPVPGGGSYSLDVDLSPYDSVAQLLRRLQLLLFSVGLAFKTRDLIKG